VGEKKYMGRRPVVDMLKTVARSLLGGPACKMYPKREPVLYDNSRGHVEICAEKCLLCGLCAKRCPTHAIIVDREKSTWRIDRLKCIICGLCVELCPKGALGMSKQFLHAGRERMVETYKIEKKAPPTSSQAQT
jgi:formate hydrogenlyase subunit 6/NADH:ubiquinone oxidoreductase subunit I